MTTFDIQLGQIDKNKNQKITIMNIHPKLKPVVYAIIVFVVFMSLSVALKLITHRNSIDDIYFGILSKKDLLIGLGIAIFLTFTHEQKKKLH